MYLIPEKELYTIIQQFYSGNYQDITNLNLDVDFDFSNVLYEIQANFYKIRSFIKLNDYTQASSLLQKLDSKIDSNINSNKIDTETANLIKTDINVLNAFIQFKESNKVNKPLLDSIDTETPSLALIYKNTILNEDSTLPDSPDLDLESYIYSLLKSLPDNSITILSNLKNHYSDALILDFAIAWLGLSQTTIDNNQINTKNSYYFFDELTSSANTDSIKNTISLLASYLKSINLPEANDCLQKIESFDTSLPSWDYSLLINKIALASQSLDSQTRQSLITELSTKFPNSPYVTDLNEKSQLFDSIIASYN